MNNLLDPQAQLLIYVNSAQVQATMANGSGWDQGCSCSGASCALPTPFTCMVYLDGTGNSVSGCTKVLSCPGMTSCTYSGDDGYIQDTSGNPIVFPAVAITTGKLYVAEYSYKAGCANKVIGGQYYPATSNLQASYDTGAFGQVVDVNFGIE
jgi:hypothetical protein